jgi:hypothetical protein
MLNQLFHSSVGFAWGVRASAFLTLGLLVIANCLMSPQSPSNKNQPGTSKPNLRDILTDVPYVLAVTG